MKKSINSIKQKEKLLARDYFIRIVVVVKQQYFEIMAHMNFAIFMIWDYMNNRKVMVV